MPTKKWIAENQDRIKAYRRVWYARNREYAMAKVVARRKGLRKWLLELKAQLSCECGETFWGCLDFHHRDPKEKVMNIAQAVGAGWSKLRILEEIVKCGVLCANCHRKETFGYKQSSSKGQDTSLSN